MLRIFAILGALFVLSTEAVAQTARHEDRVGDAYELRLQASMESRSTGGSNSSSHSNGALVERIVAIRADGLELEFDLPGYATAEDRAQDWQWPARVLWTKEGITQLLNPEDLEGRVETWLTTAGLPRESCGQWIFTWTAFQIECDPQSVLDTLKTYDLRTPLDGSGIGDVSETGSSVIVRTPIDAAQVRRERAESDIAVAQMTGRELLSLDAALAARASETVSGDITTVREADAADRPVRQTRTVQMEITSADGVVETSTSIQTVHRRPLPSPL